MNCGRRQCKRTVRGAPSFCRCGAEFCSEACFVSEWHAEHHNSCPYAAEIKEEIADRRRNADGSGTKLLVGVALTRLPPSPLKPQAAAQNAVADGARSKEADRASDPEPPVRPTPSDIAAGRGVPTPPKVEGGPCGLIAAMQAAPSRPALRRATTAACDGTEAKVQGSSAQPAMRRFQLSDFVSMGEPIGSGSYGMVTKVVHKPTAEIFAMKTITKKKVLEHQMTKYLACEVKTQIKVQHPNILRLIYYFEDAQSVFLLLEYAKGGSLFSLLRKCGYLPEPEVAGLFVDVASALDYLHRNGIVHRDLKPENILMCDGNVAKLADFGWCAELNKDGGLRHTFCGTWDYLSPEMVNNEPHDFTVDIWALGVLLFEMLTGKPPFTASSQMKAMNRITRVDLQIPDVVSDLARDLISRLIVRDRRRRLGLADAVRHPWVSQYVADVDQKVKMPVPAGHFSETGDRGALARAKVDSAPSTAAVAGIVGTSPAGWECQAEPGLPVGWGGGKGVPPATPNSGTGGIVGAEAGAGTPAATALSSAAGAAGRPRADGLGGGADGLAATEQSKPPQRAEAKELAHLPSPGSSLGSSLAPLGEQGLGGRLKPSTMPWCEPQQLPLSPASQQRQPSGPGSEQRPPPAATVLAAGKPGRLDELAKKRLDSAADTASTRDTGASSGTSTSAGTASEPARLGLAHTWAGSAVGLAAALPLACTASLAAREGGGTGAGASGACEEAYTGDGRAAGDGARPMARAPVATTSGALGSSMRPVTRCLGGMQPADHSGTTAGTTPAGGYPGASDAPIARSPEDKPASPGAFSGLDQTRTRKELWQDTNTFAAIRSWVRKNSSMTTSLGEELDKTLPGGALQAQDTGLLGTRRASDDVFSLPVTSGDQTAPLPKRRAAASKKRRASHPDVAALDIGEVGTGGSRHSREGPREPSTGSASSANPWDCTITRGDSSSSSAASPMAGAAPTTPSSRAVLAASPQTALAAPLLTVPEGTPRGAAYVTPRLQDVRQLATRISDLRSQIDRDLDSSCNALKQHFDQWEDGRSLWREIEQVTDGIAGMAAVAEQGQGPEERAGAGEQAADRAAGVTTEAAAADRAAGVAAVGADTLVETGKSWKDLDNMTDSFRGLDRLMRQMGGSKPVAGADPGAGFRDLPR